MEMEIEARINKIVEHSSKYGGKFYYVFMTTKNGESVFSCISPNMRNFVKWKDKLEVGLILGGLRLNLRKKGLIDADSNVRIIGQTTTKEKEEIAKKQGKLFK